MQRLPKRLLITGIVLCVGAPMTGFLSTVIAMIGAFHTLGRTGIAHPNVLSTHIGHALLSTCVGLVVAVALGVPLIVAALVIHFSTRKGPTAAGPAAATINP